MLNLQGLNNEACQAFFGRFLDLPVLLVGLAVTTVSLTHLEFMASFLNNFCFTIKACFPLLIQTKINIEKFVMPAVQLKPLNKSTDAKMQPSNSTFIVEFYVEGNTKAGLKLLLVY